jgi:hypothetical protein
VPLTKGYYVKGFYSISEFLGGATNRDVLLLSTLWYKKCIGKRSLVRIFQQLPHQMHSDLVGPTVSNKSDLYFFLSFIGSDRS